MKNYQSENGLAFGYFNRLGVSDGTAYRAIKEAENRGLVETRPRSGTVLVKSKS